MLLDFGTGGCAGRALGGIGVDCRGRERGRRVVMTGIKREIKEWRKREEEQEIKERESDHDRDQ